MPDTSAHLSTETQIDYSLLFSSCTIVIGLIGIVTNAIVLKILLLKNLRRQNVNIFITNQVLLDLFSSVLLVITYSLKLAAVPLEGTLGLFLCTVFMSDMIIYIAVTGSIIGLVLIAAERFFMIIHPIFYRSHVRRQLLIGLSAIPWIEGTVNNLPVFFTSVVTDGVCYSNYIWPSRESQMTYSFSIIVLTFFIPLALLVFFYGSVLYVVKKRSKLFPKDSVGEESSRNSHARPNRSELNVISTMIIVSLAFVACWFPSQVWYLISVSFQDLVVSGTVYTASLFLIFLNLIVNPFIYAAKLEPVRKTLKSWMTKPKVSGTVSSVV